MSKRQPTTHIKATNNQVAIRILDTILSLVGIIVLSPVMLMVVIIGLFDTGSPIFVQQRVGQNQRPFKLFKFRTMKLGTASVGSHLASADAITAFGRFLRKTKIDELPQFINVLKGEMSLVGPRPGLANQTELTEERNIRQIYNARPGITGLGQLANIDMSTPRRLSRYDRLTLDKMCVPFYFKLIFATALGRGYGDAVN